MIFFCWQAKLCESIPLRYFDITESSVRLSALHKKFFISDHLLKLKGEPCEYPKIIVEHYKHHLKLNLILIASKKDTEIKDSVMNYNQIYSETICG